MKIFCEESNPQYILAKVATEAGFELCDLDFVPGWPADSRSDDLLWRSWFSGCFGCRGTFSFGPP